MSQLSGKDLRAYQKEFCKTPGYVLNLTRKEFAELVETTLGMDIFAFGESNEKRFVNLLQECTDEEVTLLVEALRSI